jgi:uncharacterized protein YyaL (SSP411 family)
MARLEWREFDTTVFELAREQDRPILLLITAPWCAHCKELLDTTLADPEVVEAISSRFVAVHADSNRRPDVNERYGAGGWPTLAYLTPGGELIGNDNFLTAAELQAQLRRVADHYARHKEEIERGVQKLLQLKAEKDQRGAATSPLNQRVVDDIVDAIYEKFDHRHGGFGEGAKFPHPEAIDFALVNVIKRGDERMREVVTVTLDRMIEGTIHDIVDGGFFRYSRTPDWRTPDYEKVLDNNVQRMRCYLEAWQVFGNPAYLRTAEGILRWMLEFMLDPATGCFFGSQDADADYYALDRDGRRRREPPRLDRTIYANQNALAVSGLLKAAVVTNRPELRDRAMRTLRFLTENLLEADGTVFHYWDGTYHLPDLLSDQAYLIRALIDASQHSGDADLLLPAERIAEHAIARLSAPGGGFYDIRGDTRGRGSMQRRNRSILENSVMAEALVRLSYLSRRSEFYDVAVRALEAFASDYKEYGYYVAGYGRAVDLIFYPPLFVTIVGPRGSDATDALRRAALTPYVPSRIVQTLDPALDPILLGRSGYAVQDRPTAYVSIGKTTHAALQDGDELLRQMRELEVGRRGHSPEAREP